MADYAIQAKAQDINFVSKFESDLHNLLAVLGKSEVEVLAPGTAFKIYKSSGTLSTADVAEKALIPDSNIKMDEGTITEVTYKKYRNLTSIEDIGKKGYDVAVGGSNESLLRQVQKNVRTSIFDGIKLGTGTAKGKTFQLKVARAAAYINKKYEDEVGTPVFFVNPDEAFDYLGTANITLQTAFGLSYLQNFMGIGNVVIDSNVPAGTVYGTAIENLKVLAASITSIPGMELTTDETGIVAVHNGALYQNGALETTCYSGLAVLPVFEDRIVKVTTEA